VKAIVPETGLQSQEITGIRSPLENDTLPRKSRNSPSGKKKKKKMGPVRSNVGIGQEVSIMEKRTRGAGNVRKRKSAGLHTERVGTGDIAHNGKKSGVVHGDVSSTKGGGRKEK